MKYLISIILLCLSGYVTAEQCPTGGCDYAVTCEMTQGKVMKGSFGVGGVNYAVASAVFIYANDGYRRFYADLLALVGDGKGIPDLASPLTPLMP